MAVPLSRVRSTWLVARIRIARISPTAIHRRVQHTAAISAWGGIRTQLGPGEGNVITTTARGACPQTMPLQERGRSRRVWRRRQWKSPTSMSRRRREHFLSDSAIRNRRGQAKDRRDAPPHRHAAQRSTRTSLMPCGRRAADLAGAREGRFAHGAKISLAPGVETMRLTGFPDDSCVFEMPSPLIRSCPTTAGASSQIWRTRAAGRRFRWSWSYASAATSLPSPMAGRIFR